MSFRSRSTEIVLPPRVQAALSYLSYCSYITNQSDVAIPPRQLSAGERAVMNGALRVLAMYFSGEMDYGDAPPSGPGPEEDESGGAGVPVGV